MKRQNHPLRSAVATVLLATAGLSSFSAQAQSPQRPDATARAQIQHTCSADRGACFDGSSTQERRACLAEASAVRREALRGVLGLLTAARSDAAAPTEPKLQANALARCDAVPSEVRGDCERRVNGGSDVIVIGSVAEGVIVRELIPAEAPMVLARAETGQTIAEMQPENSLPLVEGQPETAVAQAPAVAPTMTAAEEPMATPDSDDAAAASTPVTAAEPVAYLEWVIEQRYE